jgi:hypothetical protein
MNWRPPGRNSGVEIVADSEVMTGTAVPPPSPTRRSAPPLVKMITPSRFQEARMNWAYSTSRWCTR